MTTYSAAILMWLGAGLLAAVIDLAVGVAIDGSVKPLRDWWRDDRDALLFGLTLTILGGFASVGLVVALRFMGKRR